jgi:hypothetical protein
LINSPLRRGSIWSWIHVGDELVGELADVDARGVVELATFHRPTHHAMIYTPKSVVRANDNNAGIYGTVTRARRLAVGQTIVLHP